MTRARALRIYVVRDQRVGATVGATLTADFHRAAETCILGWIAPAEPLPEIARVAPPEVVGNRGRDRRGQTHRPERGLLHARRRRQRRSQSAARETADIHLVGGQAG